MPGGEVRLRQWDPACAPDREIDDWRTAFNEVLAADLPAEPRWVPDRIREYLAAVLPDERRASFVVEEDGRLLGYAGLVLLGDDGAGTAVLELFTRPPNRGRGVGDALLSAAGQHAAAAGQRLLTAEVIGGTPAVGFYEERGFKRAMVERRQLLDLSTVDWELVGRLARRVAAGYRIEPFTDRTPEPLAGDRATRAQGFRATAAADAAFRSGFAPELVADSMRTLRARGQRPYVTAAVHQASGQIVGLTELAVPAQRPTRGDQYDTLVVPAHRGYGLGLAMKACMLLDLHRAEPQLTSVQTWQATENEPMARVNVELGFRPDREWYEYEISVAALAARLSA
jgi:GNAT superfamily N-acetyltransferase